MAGGGPGLVHAVCQAHYPDSEVIRSRLQNCLPNPRKASSKRVSTLRFLDADSVRSFLCGAGPEIEEQFGNWDRPPPTGMSPEIITIARRR